MAAFRRSLGLRLARLGSRLSGGVLLPLERRPSWALILGLFGSSGESLAHLLPTADELREAAAGTPVPVTQPLAILTDSSLAKDRARDLGHAVVPVSWGSIADGREGLALARNQILSVAAIYRPLGFICTPEFSDSLVRTRRLVQEVEPPLRQRGMPGRCSFPALLLPELWLELGKAERLLPRKDEAMDVFAVGHRDFFDHQQSFGLAPRLRWDSLGWRPREPGPEGPPVPRPRLIEVALRENLMALTLSEKLLSLGFEVSLEPHDRAALLVTDGSRNLLTPLGTGRPVALIDKACQTHPALLRTSYFGGHGRLPLFESPTAFVEALRDRGIGGIWEPYRDRRLAIEEEASPPVAGQFIEKIWLPLLRAASG
ncbi:MAG: hypothetical protein RLY93_19890 [Sumerlaeia bacterium]